MKQKCDVVLITLLDGDLVQHPEHLGVAYLAAELRKAGRTVEIFPTSPANQVEVINSIIHLKPKLVGFSLTTASFARATRVGQQLREGLGSATHITAGGSLATSLGDSLLRNPAWDFLDSSVRGDGEGPIVELLEALTRDRDLSRVPSLCHRTCAGVACNPPALAVNDLNTFSPPSRDQIRGGKQMTARIATSRGCTSRCSFCNAPNAANRLVGKVWRGRSPLSVVDEMETVYHDQKVRDFEFVDSTFEDPGGSAWAKERIANIARLILERKLDITFGCCIQAQNWHEEDLWLIRLLRSAGLQRVLVGVESGSAETLKRWLKKATPIDNRRTIRLFQSNSVYVNMGFIMFHPHSTRQELMENISFLQSVGCQNLRQFCTRMEIYPGTGVLETLRKEGLLCPEYDSTLNPFAYRFVDAEIERLAYAMALLAGEEYASSGTVDVLPPHFQFAFFDMALHSQLTREMRAAGSRGSADRLQQFISDYNAICDEMSTFNIDLFRTISTRVFSGESPREATAVLVDHVQSWYAEKMTEISQLYRDCVDEQLPFAAMDFVQYSNSPVGVQ
jgi:anaerobic magnesium-protoporphyrin IX monomethyl ester cyclase